jgi:5-methylcytosine-specific restriction endonuclease McrA
MRELTEQQGGVCVLCSNPFTAARPATLDHIRPVVFFKNGGSLRGSNRVENLQAAHADCNNVRGSLSMWQFRRQVANGRLRLPEPEPPEE